MAEDLRQARADSGLSMRRLASAAGVSVSTLSAIEHDRTEPSVAVMARLSTALGLSLSLRLYPGTEPLIHDHLQAAMGEALLKSLHQRWRPSAEVATKWPVRGVIDLVLDDDRENLTIACEIQSELRRLEQQIRWSKAKANALGQALGRSTTSQLLLLRSTRRNQHVVSEHAELVRRLPGKSC